ncbi:MAG TPA: SDR family oxidoreductase [Urbifossiella sp.]|jgi:3-oxoacyl-[acyl-carrier protein] reductase|nr:SDR family oxidoreductase [Urbifossiella sp.]
MSQTTSRAAIVTGSSRGIGKAVALRLAADGFAVTVNYAGNRTAAEAVVAQIAAAGGRAIAVGADVSKAEDVGRLFDETEKAFGGVDALVNNAGVMVTTPVAETDDATFDRVFTTNVRGVFLALREAARRLRTGGRVVNFSTSSTPLRLPGYATYCASKAAVEVYTAIFAKELRGRGITVNAVAPGPVGTELFFDGKTPEQIDRLAKLNPFERLGEPDDIARVVSFLLGPDGAWVNGQTLRANGGMV